MAGLLKNRSRPSILEIEMAATLNGQRHDCPNCGKVEFGRYLEKPPKCEDCGYVCYPRWTVHNGRGKCLGEVCAPNRQSALVDAADIGGKAYTVAPALH